MTTTTFDDSGESGDDAYETCLAACIARDGVSGPVCVNGFDFEGRCEPECRGFANITAGICTLDYAFQFDLNFDEFAAPDMADFRTRVLNAISNAKLDWKRYTRLDIERGSIVVSTTGPTKDILLLQEAVENSRVVLATREGVLAIAAPGE